MIDPMSAGDALARSGFDVDAVRRALPRVEPYAVPVRVASPAFRRFWAKGIAAVAMPWAIYVTEPVYARTQEGAEVGRDGPLIVHELAHIDQFIRLGPIRHVVRYVGDYVRGRVRGLSHWEAYRAVRLEVEAREIAAGFRAGTGPR
jgi:hypothetical protein